MHTQRIIFSLTTWLLLFFALPAWTQIRIVDEQDGQPVSGAYVFSSTNQLLCISDAEGNIKPQKGVITISNLAYEPKTIDASKTRGDVALRQKVYALPEVTVGKTEYVKLTGAFRDICRNDGRTILYREGIMDFYINTVSGKTKRRVRACRQYEDPKLRRIVNFNIAILGHAAAFDLAKVHRLKRDTVSGVSGDTTFYRSRFRGHQSDSAVMYVDTHRKGLYRHLIDNSRYRKIDNKMLHVKTDLCDWTTTREGGPWSSLVAHRRIFDYDYTPLPGKQPIAAEEMTDFVVTGVQTMTRQQAQKEMKDKTETDDFTLPDCLPAIPYDVAKETQGLVKRKFWEM